MKPIKPEPIGETAWDIGDEWTLSVINGEVELTRDPFDFRWVRGVVELADAMAKALKTERAPVLIGERREVTVERRSDALVVFTPYCALELELHRAWVVATLLERCAAAEVWGKEPTDA